MKIKTKWMACNDGNRDEFVYNRRVPYCNVWIVRNMDIWKEILEKKRKFCMPEMCK